MKIHESTTISCIAILALIYDGCGSRTTIAPDQVSITRFNVPADEYVFFEHHINTYGEIIEGAYYFGPMVDFPTYDFDSTSGILNGWVNFDINDTLIAIYGNGGSLGGIAGGGACTFLSGIYSLPYEDWDCMLTSIDKDGVITINYKDSTHILSARQEWISITYRYDTIPSGIARFTTTDRLVNYGFQAKSKIKKLQIQTLKL